jgi:MFS family permease
VAAAAPGFRQDMGLGDADLGLLFGAFFWTYASLQPLAGWLLDRYGVVRIFAACFLVWCLAVLFTGFATGMVSLLLLRLLLGAGESVSYPAYAKILASGFPEHRRGTANALIDAGSRTGPALAVLLGGMICARQGYRAMFFVFGAVGLLWLVPWLMSARHVPAAAPEPRGAAGPGIGAILREKQAWGTFFGLFCLNYTWYFVLSWLPLYLTRERRYDTETMALYGQLPFWGIAVTCALFGWISDRLIARGASPTRIRLGFVAGGMWLSTLLLPACLVQNDALSMTLLVVACLALGLTSSNLGAVTQTLAGPGAAGRWMGLQNGMGNLAGILGPYVTGLMVAQWGGFFPAFVAAFVASIAGGCSYVWIVRRVEPIFWKRG